MEDVFVTVLTRKEVVASLKLLSTKQVSSVLTIIDEPVKLLLAYKTTS